MFDWMEATWKDIKGNAKWDLIKYVFGSGVIATAVVLLRVASLYWRVQISIFVICVVGFAVIAFFQRAVSGRGARKDAVKTADSKLVIHSAVYGTGAFDDQDVIERLQATLRDALVVPVNNNVLGCDPAPMKIKRLQVEYSYGGPSILKASRAEGGRLVLPEDSEIQRLAAEVEVGKRQLEIAKADKAQVPVPALQSRVLILCGELQRFLKNHGSEPKLEKGTSEEFHDFMERYRGIVIPWRTQFHADYRLKFAGPVALVWDEIRAKYGVSDFSLDGAISRAANSPNGEVKSVQEVIEKLWDLALNLD